ncbi:ATP-binding protein [Paracoccus sp. R86501]|uniref:hybrid sensor histidine kinase/response regulator n=1 Tax=Paracoccus sp. R86501 TaxID=3101711 RepID=UPI00366F384F
MPSQQARSRCGSKAMLALPILATVILAGFLIFGISNGIRNLGGAQRDNTGWLYAQLEVDYLKLERALAGVGTGNAGAIDQLRRRFDVFYSRIRIAERRQGSDLDTPDIGKVRQMLDDMTPLIDRDDAALVASLPTFARQMDAIAALPRMIALDSITQTAAIAEAERERIVRLVKILAAAIMLVTAGLMLLTVCLARQTRTLRTANHDARDKQLRLETTLRASLDAVVVVDAHGIIHDYNGSASQIFGYTHDEAVGRDFVDLTIPPHLRDDQRGVLARFRQTDQTRIAETGRREYEMMDRDGRIFPVEISVSIARSETGPLFVSYVRDITEKRQKEEDILKARDAALDAYREKSRFFAMMSHEMRTPLNGVMAALQLLRNSPLDGEQRRFLQAALTSGDILLDHIDDVLAIERSEVEDQDRPRASCDLSELTFHIHQMMEPLASASGIDFGLERQGLDDRLFDIDGRALRQVLVNLISNAIKFAPGRQITLRASYLPADDGEGLARFEVIDTGDGIAAGDIDKIFDDFVSLDSRYERRTGGTGLGLGIARRLVRNMGGDIGCQSAPGTGARFHFQVPARAVAPDAADRPDRAAAPLPAAGPFDLLVVDDNAINRDLLEAMLVGLGHRVSCAAGGRQAIECAAVKVFDAILMDISMPEVNGMQATQAIRSADGPNRATPIIPVTAHALSGERQEFVKAGMTGFIRKPIDMTGLASTLQQIIEPDAANRPAPPPNAGLGEDCLIDPAQWEQLTELLPHDTLSERIATIIRQVDTDLPLMMTAPCPEDLRSKAHEMAGMCGMFGALRLHALLSSVQEACRTGHAAWAERLLEHLPATWEETRDAWRAKLD